MLKLLPPFSNRYICILRGHASRLLIFPTVFYNLTWNKPVKDELIWTLAYINCIHSLDCIHVYISIYTYIYTSIYVCKYTYDYFIVRYWPIKGN